MPFSAFRFSPSAFRFPNSAFLSGFWRDGAFSELVLEQASMADEGGVEGRGGDVKAGEAVEKAQTKEISPEKPPESAEGCLGRIPARSLLKPRLEIKIREVVDLGDVAGDGGIRVVQDVAVQRADPAAHLEAIVGIDTTPLGLAGFPEAGLPIGIPVAMPNPVPKEQGAAGHPEGVGSQ